MTLIPLSRNPDHTLPPDALDVRGWPVKTSLDREKVGKVDDVLLDERGRPRYLDVDLGLFNKHVLLPLGTAHVDGSDDVVWVDGLSKDGFETIPEYAHDMKALTPAYERRLEEDYRQAAAGRRGEERTVAHGELAPGQDRLARLGDLEQFRVAGDGADPRGWKVVTGDGERIGEVDELIIDTVDMQARYFDCDVAEERLTLERLDRHILIPVEQSRLERSKKRVVVDGIFAADVSRYPVYGGLPLAGDAERNIGAVYDRAAEERPAERSLVRDDATDAADPSDRFFRMRRRRAADDAADRDERIAERPRPVDADDAADRTRVVARGRDDAGTERETVLDSPDQEVRIRVSGGDIIIEKRPVE